MDSLKIRELFIFNTKLKSPKKKPSDDEAQDAKLLYYYPEDTEILVKRSNIGIVEGTLSFMQAFEKIDSNFLYTELNKTYFIANGYENDFMIGFILDKENLKAFNKYENLDTKKKWLKELLNNFYETFILFHNKLREFFLNKENPYVNFGLPNDKIFMLRDFINNYFKFFEAIKLPIIDNLQYFTMNSNFQSGILLALQRLAEKMPNLKMSSIIYKGKVIHNQLPFEIISILYNLFFSSYECTPKYNTFSVPTLQDLTTIKVEEKNPEKPGKNKKDIKKEPKKDTKVETKKEIKKENKEEIKKENKEELKKENKEELKKENKEELKNEVNIENKNEENKTENNEEKKESENKIKEENCEEKKENNEIKEENSEKYKTSPYRKVFNINDSKLEFLTGIEKDINSENNYNIFIPKLFIKELEEEFKMIIYLTNGVMFFLFFDKNFEIINQIEQIEKIPKRINNYFKEQFDFIKDLEKSISSENNTFCYKNFCNKSLKFSGFVNRKNNNIFDWKLYELLQKILFINGDTEMTSLSKVKGGFYIYYIHSLGQEVVMFFKDGLTLKEVKQEIERTKKAHFDNLFLN